MKWGNPYLSVGKDLEGKVAIDLGVNGAPETFLIDKQGIVVYRHVGALDERRGNKNFCLKLKYWKRNHENSMFF